MLYKRLGSEDGIRTAQRFLLRLEVSDKRCTCQRLLLLLPSLSDGRLEPAATHDQLIWAALHARICGRGSLIMLVSGRGRGVLDTLLIR